MSGTDIFQRHYELIARDIISYCPDGAVLDIGTGPGRLLEKLHRSSSNLRITGIDISSSMVAIALNNIKEAGLSDSIDIRKGDARDMPFPDCCFDAVISTGSVHHWKDTTSCFNEIYRVLKHGGYALLYDLVSDTPKSVMKSAAREFGKLWIFLLWFHVFEEPFYSRSGLKSLTRQTFFKDYKTRFVGVMFCLILQK